MTWYALASYKQGNNVLSALVLNGQLFGLLQVAQAMKFDSEAKQKLLASGVGGMIANWDQAENMISDLAAAASEALTEGKLPPPLGVAKDSVELMQLDPSIVVGSLVEGTIDAGECWLGNSVAIFQKRAAEAGLTIAWIEYGDFNFDLYGNGIVTSEQTIIEHPERPGRFVEEVIIDLPRPRDPTTTRQDPRFGEYVVQLSKIMGIV